MAIELHRLAIVLLSFSVALVICGLATSHWGCGSLFVSCQNADYKDAVIAVIVLLLIGAACLGIVFLLDLISLCSDGLRSESGYINARLVLLYIGSAALLIGILVFTGKVGYAWSYFATTVGCVLGMQVAILAVISSRCSTTRQRRIRA
ncbi:hypothetical protein CRM22_007719 [Opisthorchis felineus]|uniref:MARVEL domain-containing protein n=1 Tax=Opisthorchis felineus TaxID=147828 RepID=A0A4S2LN02_OPIFE|nr:hypothetical protein CRM22_007719 [Opisthorchis felineus]